MKSRYEKWIRAVFLLQAVLVDNYNTKNNHEIDPGLRDKIVEYLNDGYKINMYYGYFNYTDELRKLAEGLNRIADQIEKDSDFKNSFRA